MTSPPPVAHRSRGCPRTSERLIAIDDFPGAPTEILGRALRGQRTDIAAAMAVLVGIATTRARYVIGRMRLVGAPVGRQQRPAPQGPSQLARIAATRSAFAEGVLTSAARSGRDTR